MHVILIYGFPLILLLFEWGLRTLLSVDSFGFTGPTLAAAALSFLMPLTRPKELKVENPDGNNRLVTTRADNNFVATTWLFVFAFLFAWAAACYTSIKNPDEKLLGFATHLTIGGVTYFISLVMTAIKEKT